MASSDALIYVRGYTTVGTATARSSAAIMYSSARLLSGAYSPEVKSMRSRDEAWRPRPGSPIGCVVVNGVKYPVTADAALMKWLDTIADRLGGPTGQRLPDVVSTVEAAQTASAETAQRTTAIAQQATANAAALAAAREVLRNAGVPGADQIPPPVFDGGAAIP